MSILSGPLVRVIIPPTPDHGAETPLGDPDRKSHEGPRGDPTTTTKRPSRPSNVWIILGVRSDETKDGVGLDRSRKKSPGTPERRDVRTPPINKGRQDRDGGGGKGKRDFLIKVLPYLHHYTLYYSIIFIITTTGVMEL